MTIVPTRRLSAKVDDYLDNEERQAEYAELGRDFYRSFQGDDSQQEQLISAQVRKFQQVATAATRFSDIEIFIKNQMGKESTTANKWRAVGKTALDHLTDLREASKNLADNAGEEPPPYRSVSLALARGWAHAVVGEYLYEKAQRELGNRQA